MTALCRRSTSPRAGFYAWRARGVSPHAKQDRCSQRDRTSVRRTTARYGSPRIHHLLTAGWAVSRRRVARLMRLAGLRAKAVRGYRAKATIRRRYGQHRTGYWPRPHANQIWVGDITYIRAVAGGATSRSSWTSSPAASWPGRSRAAHGGRHVRRARPRRARRRRPWRDLPPRPGSEYLGAPFFAVSPRSACSKAPAFGARATMPTRSPSSTPPRRSDPRRGVHDRHHFVPSCKATSATTTPSAHTRASTTSRLLPTSSAVA